MSYHDGILLLTETKPANHLHPLQHSDLNPHNDR